MMEEEVLECQEYGDIFMTVQNFGQKVTRDQLLKYLYPDVRKREIDISRHQYRTEVFNLLTE